MIGLLAPTLVILLLRPFLGDGAIFLTLLTLSLVPGAFMGLMLPGGPWLGVSALVLMIITPWALLLPLEVRVLGPIPRLTVEEAPAHPLAAGFDLPGATPRVDLERRLTRENIDWTNPARGRNTSTLPQWTRYAIIPVVDPGWTPAEPVRVVAVQELSGDLPRGTTWPTPWAAQGGLLRLMPDARRERHVHDLLARAGLTAGPDLVLGRWSADAAAARWEAAGFVLTVLGLAYGCWTALVLIGQVLERRRRG